MNFLTQTPPLTDAAGNVVVARFAVTVETDAPSEAEALAVLEELPDTGFDLFNTYLISIMVILVIISVSGMLFVRKQKEK